MHRWWDKDEGEHYWLEITDRPDIGEDLNAPSKDESGHERWSYALVREATDGDVVFHYFQPDEKIVAHSIIRGEAWDDEIVWGARGTSARAHQVQPYHRPGIRRALQHFGALSKPVSLATVRENEEQVLAVKATLELAHGKPIYFPFYFHGNSGLRPQQGYFVKLPRKLLALLGLPELSPDPEGHPTNVALSSALGALGEVLGGGVSYRTVDEDVVVSGAQPMPNDPGLIERALRGHRQTQNALAAWLTSAGVAPLSPAPTDPDWDIAWSLGGTMYVAEVKSLRDENQERQLRMAVGQVLRYRQSVALRHEPCVPLIVAEHPPTDPSWGKLCDALGIILTWPPTWPGIPLP